jgi:hypothetical protein
MNFDIDPEGRLIANLYYDEKNDNVFVSDIDTTICLSSHQIGYGLSNFFLDEPIFRI